LETPFDTGTATFAGLDVDGGRHAAHVVVSAAERRFELVIVAPLTAVAAAGAPPAQPTALFVGETGLTNGEAPDRTGTVVEVLPGKGNTVSVVIGAVQEDVSLCGRRALLSPRLLHPETLSLKGVKLQRLPGTERESATQLVATAVTDQVSANVFTPLVASSGKGSPAALVDDDPQTVWTENRGGSGGGEFVVFRAPNSMGLTGLTFTTPNAPAPGYRAPKSFWVATTHAVYRVELPVPGDAAAPPAANLAPEPTSATADVEPSNDGTTTAAPNGARPDAPQTARATAGATPSEWYVAFPSPVQTSCLAISLDTAEPNDGAIDVGFAEIGATTDVDESRLSLALSDLDTGGDRAAAAEQLLQAVGGAAFGRVQKRYRSYSEAGRMRALNVMDSAPCRHAVGTYVQALYNEGSAEAEHGARGLTRCRAQAAPALARRLPSLASERTRLLTNVLVRLDPVAAVDAMTPLLSGGSRAKRRVLRLAFSSALADAKAAERARVLLSDAKLESRAALFLMRALGNRLANYVDIAAPRLRQLLEGANFDVRYLALAPAAQLANKDPALQTFVRDSLARAKEPAIRTEAARVLVASTAPASKNTLIAAIDDPHVRVREAAITSAGDQVLDAARNALHQRLEDDVWPLVRSAAVRALGQLPPNAESAKLLAQVAEEDAAPSVRRPAVHVLGIQNARSTLPTVREVFTDDQDPDVRATAAASLGLMCDRSMTDALTRKALEFGRITSSESERLIGKASLTALGRLAPPDLMQRLAPFFVKGVPQMAQAAANAALHHPEPCPK
jgi:HEAT repeat protein